MLFFVQVLSALGLLTAYLTYSLQLLSILPSSLASVIQKVQFQFPFSQNTPVLSSTTSDEDVGLGHFARHIVAVGDIHGDLPNMLKVLRMTSVVDEHGHWTGEVDWLVQTGDIIDR